MSKNLDVYQSQKTFSVGDKSYKYYSLDALEQAGIGEVSKLPYSIKVLLESVLRQYDDYFIKKEHVENLAKWGTDGQNEDISVPFKPSRVILQDFTGVPTVVDLAALRKAMADLGGDASQINPEIPVDLVIDHSVQVDKAGTSDSLIYNMNLEFKRNAERYEFLSWAKKAFDNYRAVPPATGIVHQVNLEYLANVVHAVEKDGDTITFPDTLVGTDSHTTMINGIGVLGWGVGGIEAEAGMLGQPSYFPVPEVIGVKFTGELPSGTTATDVALKVTQVLREKKVVGKFVEFFGPGLEFMPLADRATISNMAPEYGATCGFFPVDAESLNYLRLTGRSEAQIALVEQYSKENGLFYVPGETPDPTYTDVVEIELSEIEANLSGPKRPQDLVPLSDMQSSFRNAVVAPQGTQGLGLTEDEFNKEVEVKFNDGRETTMKTGSIAIAAITSCTNTSNPYVLIGAGLVAKKAVEFGLEVPEYVKTSLAPGSKVVTGYLTDSGLLPYMEKLGYNIVGYGCTTCIGNSGPLEDEIEAAIADSDLTVTSVLSGNRNFEGRIHPLVKANYLASPPLVVAYSLAGTVDIDLKNDPIGTSKDGKAVYFSDIWPTAEEIRKVVKETVTPELFRREYEDVFSSNERWNEIDTTDDSLYKWDDDSTYIANPPFFEGLSKEPEEIKPLTGLRVIGKFGDTVTTDHISPAGAIGKDTPAGKYLLSKGVEQADFNSYGSRRGHHEVMMRGTFANIRIRNQIAPGTEGGYTTFWPTGEVMSIYDAAMKYKESDTGLTILAGKDYGMGSSRDWAAKGTNLLGIKTVIAESYERIHRSNLVLMGVLPLQFKDGESAESLGLTGKETIEVQLPADVKPRQHVTVVAVDEAGNKTEFEALVRFDSEVDVDYYKHGGILQMVLRQKLA
ncbi:aconitate hydratase [Alkalihalobacillus alcalophilus ATCC 27647 = CGMCC 1.3604]|uniref:Aconitate hydratase n=1 Tax=Alkalihalobacillus alcalophilus ATCC 27647 = CGMCC 1.3604 TaxID=1218173 RepID=A0A094XEU8_ALKAL|nr:aconitate hydratase AcnA [Alkalihalobacillus alcalophilus]KGA97275.1 aconitate hydratase [Alkalihalobacillus alcalophilus ATCC 27647 = CGMCC 1.3604]MED1562797.1 aconitate hydratase AcnA [Alkalihalobacillus alcalophilus]THG91519.1 aconitate hydratase [Alkalihalobacillus alcalophilus ATCC 27647 = CGMCC 1.3604]